MVLLLCQILLKIIKPKKKKKNWIMKNILKKKLNYIKIILKKKNLMN